MNRKRKVLLRVLNIVVISMLVTGFVMPSQGHASTPGMPFVPGEKLTFTLKWEMVPAGKAVLEVLPIKTLNGEDVYHFVMTVKTNSFVDVFYKVRDKIESYTDLNMTRSLFYKKKQREGKYKRNIVVNFDWKQHQAQYSNSGKTKAPISILPGSFDPLSALYYARLTAMQEDSHITRPVTDGKKNIVGVVNVLKRETITVDGDSYDTYLIEPDTSGIGGVFKKSKDAKIYLWITADERRLPVKIKSKVAVGSFIGELVSVEGMR